jgi:hypothetical protein
MGDRNAQALYPGRDTPTARARIPVQKPFDPNDDDPLDFTTPSRSNGMEPSQYVVAPSIQVRPEFSSLTRTHDQNQPLTCIVVIELPGKRTAGAPGPVMSDSFSTHRNGSPHPHSRHDTPHSGHSSPRPEHQANRRVQSTPEGYRRESPSQAYDNQFEVGSQNGTEPTPPYQPAIIHEEDSAFNAITEDLRNRIIDWKGHPLSDLGPLQMYDLLSVRRDNLVREFYVYLFKEALICVVEEKKRSLGRLLSNASGLTDSSSTMGSSNSRGVLRLRGRIYVRHIKHVTASSAAGEMSLTIDMEDELASFILIYKDRSSLEAWKNTIQALVNMYQGQNGQPSGPATNLDVEEFGGSQKAMRMLSGSTQTSVSTVDSLLHSSSRSTMSSSTSHTSSLGAALQQPRPTHMMGHKLSGIGEDDELSSYDSPTGLVTPYTSSGPSNSLSPLPHSPMDLILVISVPPPNAAPSTAQLKIRVIKTTLDFIMASMGPKDRVSFVTFEVGVGGRVRKTPFLSAAKGQSKDRLSKFIDELTFRADEGLPDDFLVRGSKEEKTDVVTAVNHGQCFGEKFGFMLTLLQVWM